MSHLTGRQFISATTAGVAAQADVPIMIHIGGQTSPLPRILDLLRPGDVVTHALRRQGSILDANGRIHPEVREAVRNGIHLDVGHGRGNLDFDVAEAVLQPRSATACPSDRPAHEPLPRLRSGQSLFRASS